MERQAQQQQARAEALARREEARKQQAEQPYVIIDQSNDESVQGHGPIIKDSFQNISGTMNNVTIGGWKFF